MSEYRERIDHFESNPQDRELYSFLNGFYYYLHNQEYFISKLKSLDVKDTNLLRKYYKTLQGYISMHPEFVHYWCTRETIFKKPNSPLYEELENLDRIIFQIILKQLEWRQSPE